MDPHGTRIARLEGARLTRTITAGAITAVLVLGGLASLAAHDPIGTKLTWTRDISRVFQARCVECHTPAGRSPMPLTTYEEVVPWTSAIRLQVLTRKMPIWHAARGYGAFANDPSLSPFDIAAITTWIDAGAPRGEGPEVRAGKEASRGADRTPAARLTTVPCAEPSVAGRLLAIRPQLQDGASAGITAVLPDGRREIVAWIRDYDARHDITYWLRAPLTLPRGSRLKVEAPGVCSLTVTLAR